MLRSLVEPVDNPTREYQPFHPIPAEFFAQKKVKNQTVQSYLENLSIVYSPSPHKIIDQAMGFLKTTFRNIKGYKNAKLLEAHFLTDEGRKTLAGIQFDDNLYNQTELPQKLQISIRFPGELRSVGGYLFKNQKQGTNVSVNNSHNESESIVDKLNKLFQIHDWKTNLLYPVFQSPGPREPEKNSGATPSYHLEGFLALQILITYFLLLTQNEVYSLLQRETALNIQNPVILLQRFPHAAWREDPLLPALISFIGILIMLSFVYTCINTVKVITVEKEKQLKEVMKIMGLSNWIHWTAWFTKCFLFLLISISFMTALLTISWYPQTTFCIFTYSNPIILFLFLLFYVCATITFCFSVSVFFSKANTAATVAGLLWFLSYAPYLFLQSQYEQLSLSTKMLVSLGSNTAMAYGFQLFLMFESTTEGIQWHNMWQPITQDDSLTLGLILVMLAIDTLIYLFIALYIEAVFPGDFGTPQPWYFPLTCSYWCGYPKGAHVHPFDDSKQDEEFFEKNENLNPKIEIRNLRKVFGKKTAVNNLTLTIYGNQITVLLGHNGAGKTTTMSMLIGIIPPTSGIAMILGRDIQTNMKNIRANIGLCPQHNILFDELTVKEHLYFFCKLKGLSSVEIEKEIGKYVNLLELQPKINKKSTTLSGGMKRKLCVAIALCGGSKIVLLDEPTAGMDPSSRRALWDLLQVQKNERSILLTTHYMDEADLLGDRIAIMANGELKCCGTSFFLKKKYGAGYHLILEKLPNCNPKKITELLKKYIPDIQIHGNVGSELSYLLKENYVAYFENLLYDLEINTENLGIRSYGISLTTLEDVFLKVGADPSGNDLCKNISSTKTMGLQGRISPKNITLSTGLELIRNQFIAMLMKKTLTFMRTWLLQLVQIIIPVAFLIIAIVVSRNLNKNKFEDLPKLLLTPHSYKNPIFLVEDHFKNQFSQNYFKNLEGFEVKSVTDLSTAILNLSRTIPAIVKKKYIVGASFAYDRNKSPVLTAWFNNNPYHTPALSFGLVLNSMYQVIMGPNHSIVFANHPLPFTMNTKVDRLLKGNSMGFQVAFNIGFSMSFVSSFYILFYVKERVCKAKHLQFLSGVKGYIFWTTSFLCDLTTFAVTILAVIITLLCFGEEGFSNVDELGRLSFLLFYFGFAMLPMMYFASYYFEVPSTGFTRMTLFNVCFGVTAFLVVQILLTPGLFLKYVADALHWCFLLIPHYSLATGIRDTYITFATSKMCNFLVTNCMEYVANTTRDKCWDLACHNYSASLSHYCCEKVESFFKWEKPGIGRNITYSLLTGIMLFIFVILCEYKIVAKMRCFRNYGIRTFLKVPYEDQDVLDEKIKIRNSPESKLLKEYDLLLKDLTKYYRTFLAVNGLCLGVKQYECFGLLGINGAGKTTTFKMITGDTKITFGDVWIHGFSAKTNLKDVQKVIGYCPQFDALLTNLTAKETLIIFALIRGVPLDECTYVAEKLARDFDFYQHLNKTIKLLSGGNKRKLSTAISLIGDPPVICLDEPTAGMDPVTKRNLWNALCTVRDNGKCILLTSHSMEECEALCTRLAIMVNGDFKCLGSVQHLKNKFAAGFTLTIKVKREESSETIYNFTKIDKFVAENFPGIVQQEKHQELATYYIIDHNESWSRMFGILESARSRLNIEDYFLGQASLEQIFLTLTQLQR
ncbi:phospholipid-transporting ATPase ABCA3 isoform X2 [Tribolium castaneum]|nr:PREDICTED: ATP-binding cassette sub-family A member 3 isoform X2 [Tribolium castaneum]XP_015840361.1 PREDICTED: ATP-binding cassette sub-family A member 3 isoform X2 [Tribolium castaneum]|eukprot:XP_015840360.1 PREDICTED: ATP-binding cassette sub-family A member 3 isoform X2 [Tribolium castaneum]